MMHTVVLTRRAERDIESAAAWWAMHRSAEQASRWLAGLEDRIRSLKQSPLRHPRAAEHAAFNYDIRELRYGLGHRATHRAIFTVVDDLVVILAIRHLAQDQLRPGDIA